MTTASAGPTHTAAVNTIAAATIRLLVRRGKSDDMRRFYDGGGPTWG
jgi:hypothetical protein